MNIREHFVIVLVFCSCLISGCGTPKGSSGRNEEVIIVYDEKFRPQFHFSPEKGWMNDPNGLVYFDGEYHLFYQYYPDSTVWGPMHWGHAVSTDLVHWQNLPIALYPDSLGYIFSGSAVVDRNNTSGFGTSDKIPLVAIYALHNPAIERSGSNTFENQAIAYSLDKGRTWIKYPGNPVLKNPGIRDFRDPKVFWHRESGKWIMILAVHDRVHLYSSPDLKNWTFESEFGKETGAHGGVWECPDLFPLNVKGKDQIKWVMLVSINPGGPNGGSATQYFTGDFDGHNFVADDTLEKWVDYGPDNYAGVTWSDIPETDGRRLFLGWMSNWNYAAVVPSSTWRSAMTGPRDLSLIKNKDQYMLISKPVKELEALRIASKSTGFQLDENSKEEELLDDSFDLSKCELVFEFNFGDSFPDTLKMLLGNKTGENLIVGLSFITNEFYIDRRESGNTSFSKSFPGIATAPYQPGKTLKIRILLDATSSELFADDGKLVMTGLFFPSSGYSNLRIFSKGGSWLTGSCKFYELEGIWQKNR